jgi:hypothetical protein
VLPSGCTLKKWSIRKKSVNNEIVANEPRPVKNRSIKHIFKMNFLPITFLLYFVIAASLVFLFVGDNVNPVGNDVNGGGTTGNTVIMTAQQYNDDIDFTLDTSEGWVMNVEYRSLEEGDTLILKDRIYKIERQSFSVDATSISFDVDDYTRIGVDASEIAILIEGDITDEYEVGDNVRITVTVKHFEYTNETSGATFDMEVFEEGWNQNSFMANFFTQILPKNVIEKV